LLPGRTIAGMLGLVSVACPGFVAGSREYKPVSDREAAVLARATREVYPDDVRREPERHAKTFVAWVGILKKYEASRARGGTDLWFDLEHRYFDWIEDFGLQPERLFISPRGEGAFRATWSLPPDAYDRLGQNLHEGDLIVVYGYPSQIQDGVVGIHPTEYVRLLPRVAYSDKKLDYGRRAAKP
jgi:hypothetical protein